MTSWSPNFALVLLSRAFLIKQKWVLDDGIEQSKSTRRPRANWKRPRWKHLFNSCRESGWSIWSLNLVNFEAAQSVISFANEFATNSFTAITILSSDSRTAKSVRYLWQSAGVLSELLIARNRSMWFLGAFSSLSFGSHRFRNERLFCILMFINRDVILYFNIKGLTTNIKDLTYIKYLFSINSWRSVEGSSKFHLFRRNFMEGNGD